MRSSIACLIALSTAACAASPPRAEPPSGAVDPGAFGLATPGEAARPAAAPRPADPTAPAGASLGDLSASLPALPGAAAAAKPAASPPRTGAASGKMMTMTRDHCAALGRKFAELTMAQAGDPGASPTDEAKAVGRTFADKCNQDMAGQAVEVREYECMLHAKAAEELLGCKQ